MIISDKKQIIPIFLNLLKIIADLVAMCPYSI